jgi:hypothetical protein
MRHRVAFILSAAYATLVVICLSLSIAFRGDLGTITAGPAAHKAMAIVELVSFPASSIAKAIFVRIVTSPRIGSIFGSIIPFRTIDSLFLGLYWPLIAVLGTLQWFATGLILERLWLVFSGRKKSAM